MSRESVAIAIANKVRDAERINAAMLGHDLLDIAMFCYAAWTETFNRAFETERPAVNLPWRWIKRVS